MTYIKTKLGEHDYHKRACSEYCTIRSEYCPFAKVVKVPKIVRWTDLEDNKVENILSDNAGGNNDEVGYAPSFGSVNDAGNGDDSLTSQQIQEEMSASGYTCWGDGSGFEYDKMSRNVIGTGSTMENIYDISNYGIDHNVLQFSSWNAWIDKFQYDYRFGRVSDTNAECVLFPNVDNPWMFTEYVFKGIGGDKKKCAWDTPKEYVIEPIVYDISDLSPVNTDMSVTDSGEYSGKYADQCIDINYDAEHEKYNVRRCRKIINWGEWTRWSREEAKNDEARWNHMNSGRTEIPCNDAGMTLYSARIPVQSVKWGEHGNIPPHTVDMTAPKSWFDPANTVTRMKAVYDAVVGSVVMSPYNGKITWNERYASVYTDMTFSEYDESTHSYTYSGGTKTEIQMPSIMKNGEKQVLKPAQKIMPSESLGEYCHDGCANLIGIDGKMYCNLMRSGNDYTHEQYFIASNGKYCLGFEKYGGTVDGKACDKYIPSTSKLKIASYQDKKMGVDQISFNVRGAVATGAFMATAGGVMGAGAGVAMAGEMIGSETDKIAQYYSNLGKRGDVEVTYIVRYEPVVGAEAQAQLNKKKYNEFGKGVQIVPGTGKYAIDSEANANPFSGGDTNVYDDINTLSFHRFFASVMHCANQKYCNAVAGQSQKDGFSYSKRAGGEGECRYYKDKVNGMPGCPHNAPPKRAVEFAYCSMGISTRMIELSNAYHVVGQYCVWDLNPGNSAFPNTAGMYRIVNVTLGENSIEKEWLLFDFSSYSLAVMQLSDTVAVLAVKDDGFTENNVLYNPDYFGAAMFWNKTVYIQTNDGFEKLVINPPSKHLMIGMMKTEKTVKTVKVVEKNEEQVEVEVNKECRVYKVKDVFYWFQPLTNDGSTLSYDESAIPSLRQHVDEDGCWLCNGSYNVPTTNCTMIDNEEKFIGGWHPEYKDYSKIGGEFMQDIVSDASREGQGMGDYIQNGDFTPVPQQVNKKGYWIDQSGQYILDERSIGTEYAIAGDSARDGNSGDAPCISFKKSNTEVDAETGRKRQPKTLNAAVFANDSYDFLINVLKKEGRPKYTDPDTNNEYSAPPIINNRLLLPTMRHALHCPNCDYYIPWKYHIAEKASDSSSSSESSSSEGQLKYDERTCPWCGSNYEIITGSEGGSMKEGDKWSDDASIIRKFFKIYSLGMVDVWAPPGTAIKTDAYFWRHQAQITNAVKKQILHRLGTAGGDDKTGNKYTGGVYKFDKMTPSSEMTLGYPEGIGKFIRVPRDAEIDTTTDLRYTAKYIKWKPNQDSWVDGMYNPIMPRHMIPGFYDNSDNGHEDEGVIAPYTDGAEDALKAVSVDQMRVLRNAVQPIYAYTSEETYSGDYPTYRASYDQREKQNQPIIWQGRKSVISPQVLAVTDGDHEDAYQTYFSGDLVYGNVREYFPSGYTWWMLKNVIGGRYTSHKGGDYHMDLGKVTEEEMKNSAFWDFLGVHEEYTVSKSRRMSGGSGGVYTTSDRTVAKCAISIYGLVPLDKEIIRGYIIVRPSGVDPSKNPIGRSWTGGPVMYHHYHAFPKDHYEDGKYQHLHGTAGYPNDQYFDDDGNFVDPHPNVYYLSSDIHYQDDSAYRLWGRESHLIDDDRGMYYEDRTKDIMTSIPCLYDTAFYQNVGTAKRTIYSYEGSEILGVGYDENSFGDIAGFTLYNLGNTEEKRKQKFQYIVVDKDGFVVNKYPDSRVWKTDTAEQIEKTINRHTARVELKVSDGTKKNTVSYTFTQVDSDLYANQMPRQSQPITGYFDMSWANVKGYVYGEYEVEKKSGGSEWNAPVIFQDPPGKGVNYRKGVNDQYTGQASYSGGGSTYSENVGQVAHCIDITKPLQDMWNKRVRRAFGTSAGCTFDDMKKWKFYSPIAKDGLSECDYDVVCQNRQTVEDGYTSLTDLVGYPDLEGGIDDIPELSADGDKYKLAPSIVTIHVGLLEAEHTFGNKNCNYDITVGDENRKGSLTRRVLNASTLKECLTTMFGEIDLEKIDGVREYLIYCEKDVTFNDCDNSCYMYFEGYAPLSWSGTYIGVQNRILDSTRSVSEPINLFTKRNGSWSFSTYEPTYQYFVFDMLRAPLCKSQKNWRYEAPSNDSPGDGIMTYEYDAMFSPNPYITRVHIYPSPLSHVNYRVFARAHGFDTWRCILKVAYENNAYKVVQHCENSVAGMDDNGYVVLDIDDGKVRARFIKVECDAEMMDVEHKYKIQKSDDNSNYHVIAVGNFSDMGMFSVSFANTIAHICHDDNGTEVSSGEYGIVSTSVIDDTHMFIALSREFVFEKDNNNHDIEYEIKFQYPKQVGGIDEFKVFGVYYKTESSGNAENDSTSGGKFLTVTGFEDEFQWRMQGTGINYFKMPEPPTQILEVSVGSGGSGDIRLSSADRKESLAWQTEDLIIGKEAVDKGDGTTEEKDIILKRIVGGNYFYDVHNGKIWIPDKNSDGVLWENFEQAIRENANLGRSYCPDTLIMRYWSGNGRSITFKAKAVGHGPSYMVEKNAIQKIDEETYNRLPKNGTNCKMIDINGSLVNAGKIEIPWTCYNNVPATVSIENQSRSNSMQGVVNWTAGEFRKPNFTGKEIHEAGIDDDMAFVNLYGENCENCYGQCETEITLTGAPNQIISGDLLFWAEEKTTNEVNVNGKILKYEEKTGGLANGILIVSCAPTDPGEGRVTLTYDIPEIVIYAKESQLYTVGNEDKK